MIVIFFRCQILLRFIFLPCQLSIILVTIYKSHILSVIEYIYISISVTTENGGKFFGNISGKKYKKKWEEIEYYFYL